MFDPRSTHLDKTHVNNFDLFRYVNRSSDSFEAMNYGARARKIPHNYDNYRNNWNGDGVQLRPRNMEYESGVCSPPLWKNSPPRVPQNSYRNLSPNSRTQAIARGQWELMEMVKNMPELCYELSLKDLVEQPRLYSQEECLLEEKNSDNEALHQRIRVSSRQESNKFEKSGKMMRSGSIDKRGLFLKMDFPFSLGMSRRKNKNSAANASARVSPRPEALEKSSKTAADVEWWKKRSSVSSESGSGGSNSNSRSTGRSSSSRKNSHSSRNSHSSNSRNRSSLVCCWPFYRSNKNNPEQ